ncbi:copper resistance protein CopC [Micromonospora sp. GCM10011542]|uniref:copper resistance CopC family protein n=1 Tax=Micromonospora sp. GCM10011542 TaxID=3317337 RepID=UPI00360E2508
MSVHPQWPQRTTAVAEHRQTDLDPLSSPARTARAAIVGPSTRTPATTNPHPLAPARTALIDVVPKLFPRSALHRSAYQHTWGMRTLGNSRLGVARMRAAGSVPGLLISAMVMVAFLAVDVVRSAPAVAHSALTSASPAAGSVNDAAPASVSLVFGRGILSASLTVTDGCDRTVPAELTVRKRDLRATLRAGEQARASGSWSVRWRAVSSDGHAISGEVPFTVAGTATCAASAPPSAGPDNSPSVAAAADVTGPQQAGVTVSSERGMVPAGVLVALAVVLLGAGSAVLAGRRRGPPAVMRDES